MPGKTPAKIYFKTRVGRGGGGRSQTPLGKAFRGLRGRPDYEITDFFHTLRKFRIIFPNTGAQMPWGTANGILYLGSD